MGGCMMLGKVAENMHCKTDEAHVPYNCASKESAPMTNLILTLKSKIFVMKFLDFSTETTLPG